jgi:hypothetical protein
VLNLPEPPSGIGSLLELLRGILHVISRDPRSLTFKTPYANAGLEGTEFDIRVDADERLTEIIVLEGEVAVTTPNGNLEVASDYIAVARDGQAPTASPLAQPIERMRWASYTRRSSIGLPGADARNRWHRSRQIRTSMRTVPPPASRRRGSTARKPTSPPRCA